MSALIIICAASMFHVKHLAPMRPVPVFRERPAAASIQPTKPVPVWMDNPEKGRGAPGSRDPRPVAVPAFTVSASRGTAAVTFSIPVGK